MTLVRISEVVAHYGVPSSTIRRWIAGGLIKEAGRTFGGHRRFQSADFDCTNEQNAVRKNIGYARVSSHDQKEDLIRQIARLKDAGCDEVISDIGSGLNCGKPGLRQLLRRLLDSEIHTFTVMHEDRLLRFGVGLMKFICSRMRMEFRVIEKKLAITFEEELAKDIVTVMTVFCARLYGRRSHKNKKSAVLQ